ncbi:MAG: sensor histidine kinase KdpD [Polyangiaceae bacterium]
MEPDRPDPQALLARARAEESKRRRGKLTVYFGAAPGVGKTYAMLEAGRAARAEGVDVVVGVVETHGRYDTASLVLGLEVLPRRRTNYRGIELAEFDVDAALARRPGLVLVDELAHTNVEGSRHAKRWQDVEELVAAGIDVSTTLNVQHLESLVDVVRGVTGVDVRETVPDSVVESADELRLVDLTPDALLARLRDGKVYLGDAARRAETGFFRKGNLIALRELALRRTADRVDTDMRDYRRDHGIEKTWAARERILVCVSPSPNSARLVRSAYRMANAFHAPWIAAYVDVSGARGPSSEDKARIHRTLTLAETLGGEAHTLVAEPSPGKSVERLVDFARGRNVTRIVVGKPTHPRWRDRVTRPFVDELVRESGPIDVHVISGEGEGDAGPARRDRDVRPVAVREIVEATFVVAGSTATSAWIFGRDRPVDTAMAFLLGIVLVAMRHGYVTSVYAAFTSVVAFDVFFVPPYFSFAVSDFRYVTTFVVMLVVAVVISGLTQRVRRQAASARSREAKTASLYALSGDVAGARDPESIVGVVGRHFLDVFDAKSVVLLPDDASSLRVIPGGTFVPDTKDLATATWVWDREKPAGLGTDTLPNSNALYVPLTASRGRIGVLGVVPADPSRFADPEERRRLASFANQVAVAVERSLLVGEARRAEVRAETERLRNSLLSSVSHDLRTPLAVLKGAGSALLADDGSLTREQRGQFARSIVDDADRLDRIVRNLLDMTRVDAGVLRVTKEWHSIEEIVGSALARIGPRIGDRVVSLDVPAALPLVPLDALLVEQVLTNLVENAVRHTPAHSPIEVAARVTGTALEVRVSDRGPGVPPTEERRVFEKFRRGRGSATGGIGLGLPICKGMIEAQGGTIDVVAREGGGATFRFTLPIEGDAPVVPAETEESASRTTGGREVAP